MNAAERQVMRDQHSATADWLDLGVECNACWNPYPCDTIKMLDAYEELLEAAEKILGLDKPTTKFEGIDQMFLNYINRQV